jgi:N-acyl-D-aspartate/D-glutamate deacylase
MPAFDLVLNGGTLIDGLGGPRRRADVGVRGGRVVALGDLGSAEAVQRRDVSGRIVAPGFVDIHAHSDFTILSDPRAQSAVRQGITTQVNGNCGMSPVPAPPARAAEVRAAVNTVDPDPAVATPWTTYADYVVALAAAHPAIHQAPLIGHITLKVAAGGNRPGPATPDERAAMVAMLEDAFAGGAVGVSTGLMFPPAISADRAELIALGATAARHDRLFAAHMRNYNDHLIEAVEEVLDVARETGCRLQVSHLAVAGKRNWGKVPRALELIDRARADGLDVAADIYPYVAGSANLSQLLPEWAQDGGTPEIVRRLGDDVQRQAILDDWATSLFFGWDEVEIVLADPGMEDLIGLTVEAIGRRRGQDPALTMLDLVRDTENRILMVAYGRSEDDLRAVLSHPATSIGSDSLAMDPHGPSGIGRPHPRNFGCYPRFLGRYVREQRLTTLEHAVAMCTSAAADRVGLTDRGRLVDGAAADIVVFDEATILDRATFEDPKQFPVGIDAVLVNGRVVVDGEGQADNVRAGEVLGAAHAGV